LGEKVEKLSPDRLRAMIDVLMTVTVAPVGKGYRVFNPDRVDVVWKEDCEHYAASAAQLPGVRQVHVAWRLRGPGWPALVCGAPAGRAHPWT
jgi:hypothetical protein